MAEPRKKLSDIEQRLLNNVSSDKFELKGFGAGVLYKAEKNTSDELDKKKPQKPAKTEFEEWVRNWKPGDALPIIPPGKILRLDSFGLDPSKKIGFVDKEPERKRSLNEIGLMASKSILGRTINGMPGASSLLAMVARGRGIPVDDQGKLRCPAGTAAANQFTDLQLSNCMVPSAATLAGDAVDLVRSAGKKPGKNTLSGAIAGLGVGERNTGNGFNTFGSIEAARRFLSFKIRQKTAEKTVAQIFGNVANIAIARKALMRAYPNMDEESLKDFLNDNRGLSGQRLADYLDIRQAFIVSLLDEALIDPESAARQIFWKFSEDMGGENAGFQVNASATEDIAFVEFTYNPVKFVDVYEDIKSRQRYNTADPENAMDWLALGSSSDVENPLTPRDFGSYVGVHEFSHLNDFHARFKDLGLEVDDTNYDKAVQRINDKQNAGETPTPGEVWLHERHTELYISQRLAPNDAAKQAAIDNFYDQIGQALTNGFSQMDDGRLVGILADPEIQELIRDLAGSEYAHQNPIEARAEFRTAARKFPEILQERIDIKNKGRTKKLPDLDDLTKAIFGLDIVNPLSNADNVPKPGVRRRVVRAARTFGKPDRGGPKPADVSAITNDVAEAYVEESLNNLLARQGRRKESLRKKVTQTVFSAYAPEEIKNILSSIPQNQRTNSRFLHSLLTVPEVFKSLRSPSGGQSQNEQDWMQYRDYAINEDWIDFTSLTDAYVLGGGAGPLKTIDAVRKERKRVKLDQRNKRQASNSSQKLTKKITGSISNPRISKISGAMGWVNTDSLPVWSKNPDAPKVENRVPVSLSPIENSGKTLVNWGDDTFEIDTSIDPNEMWKSEAFNEWATFHGNFAMRYVSAMLMGQDVPVSEGYREETLDEGLKSIHDELVSGTTKGLDATKQKRVRQEIDYAVAALRTLNSVDNAKPYEIFRGLTGVPDEASILNLKKGETIELPLSAFTPSEDWAYEMGEFTEDGQGVILKVLPGAHSTPTNDEYVENPTKKFDNYFEVVTAGKFEVVEFDDRQGEQTVITLRQTETFDPVKSSYFPVETPDFKTPSNEASSADADTEGIERFTRPAPRREISKLTGKIKVSASGQTNYGLPGDGEVKEFDGFDHVAALDAMEKIIKEIETRHGKIETVADAAKALKTVFKKVQINHMGENFAPGGKSELSDTLTKSEQAAISGILYTLNNSPNLKSRRLIISHEISNGGFSPNGSTALMPRLNKDGGPDFPEYGIRINIPFNESVAEFILGEEENNIDGVGNQISKALLIHAQTLSPGQERDSYEQAALISFFIGTSIHESIHALDMPQINDLLHAEAMQEDPSLTTERARLDHIFKRAGGRDVVLKNFAMREAITAITFSNVAKSVGASMEYEKTGPDEFLTNGKLSIDSINTLITELTEGIDDATSVSNDGSLDVGERLQASLNAAQLTGYRDGLNKSLNNLKNLMDDLEENIDNGTPENSTIGILHRSVYDSGLNYISDVFPPGHPGHGTDVDLTVDVMGNMVASVDKDGDPIKELMASPEYMESTIISLIKAKDFHEASENAGFSLNGIKDLLDDLNIDLDDNGNDSFDFNYAQRNMSPDDIDELVELLAQAHVAALSAERWAPGIDDKTKWELLDWMRMISRYGSMTHFRYRTGLTKPTNKSVISVEVTAELITSLMLGAGAARTPMSPEVRGAIINILDWVYGGDSWKSILPDISLEALKVK